MSEQSNNPDSLLKVTFYQREVDMGFLSNEKGRPVKAMVPYVRIEVPGNMLSIIDTIANDSHKDRFPVEWARFQNSRETGAAAEQGTILSDWPLLTPAQASELRHFKFYTVEQVANASDLQIDSIGMLVGMSPFAFRDKAKAFLAAASDSALVSKQADALRERDEEIAKLREQGELQAKAFAQMQEQIKKLTDGAGEAKNKGGRPRKTEQASA